MASFQYRGVTDSGEPVTGLVDAEDQAHALRVLKERRLEITKLSAVKTKKRSVRGGKPKSSDYFELIEQMSVLIGAGIPILETVDSLRRSTSNAQLSAQLDNVAVEMRRGLPLSLAMRSSMPALPELVTSLIELGEQTGQLDTVLSSVADQLSKQEKIKRDLYNALTYPMFLSVVGLGAVLFLFLFVVPRFSNLIGDNFSELPGMAKAVFIISDFLREDWIFLAGFLGFCVVLCITVYSSRQARSNLLSLVFSLPIIGQIFRLSELANWTRTVGLAFGARANLINAVSLAQNTVSSQINRAAFGDVARELRAGSPLDLALSKVPYIEPIILNLVSTGVRAGRLSEVLMVATRILDERVEVLTERLSRLAEPIAIMVISAVIGMVVIGLVTAMTSLYDFAV
jgi:general secretion pathway protein F